MLYSRQTCGAGRLPLKASAPCSTVIGTLVFVFSGWIVLGLLGSDTNVQATAAPPNTHQERFNLDYVPGDAIYVLALRPAVLSEAKGLSSIKSIFTQLGFFEAFGIALDQIEELKFIASGDFLPRTPPAEQKVSAMLVLRSKQQHDWTKFATSIVGAAKASIVNGQTCFLAPTPKPGKFDAYWLPDDRTIVITSANVIGSTFSLRGPLNQPTWADKWKQVADNPAALMVKMGFVEEILIAAGLSQAARDAEPDPEIAFFKGAEVGNVFQVMGTIECRSREGAEAAHHFLKVALEAARNTMKAPEERKPNEPIAFSDLMSVVGQLLNATKLDIEGSTVFLQTAVTTDVGRLFVKSPGPARVAARRSLATSKMKRLALALLMYENAHKEFPSASVFGPDGKTPHSWRVELLPYLEKNDLYERYKMDEPWDSTDNLKLVKEGADLFSGPTENANGDCGYFLLAGPGTAFDPDSPPSKIRSVIDGTSKTIGLVEAKRAIPWTKPEDIDYDPDKPLPKLGGFFDEGFHVGYLDTHVQFLPRDFDDATLRALFSKAGREPTPVDPETGLPSLQVR